MAVRWAFCVSGLLMVTTMAMGQTKGWTADEAVVSKAEKDRPGFVYRESQVPTYELPDVLRGAKTRAEWEKMQRSETLGLFTSHVYGAMPPKPDSVTVTVVEEDKNAMGGAATLVRWRIKATAGAKSFEFPAAVFVPNQREKKAGAFVFINNRGVRVADLTRQTKNEFWSAEEIVARGHAAAIFNHSDVDPDKDGAAERAKGVYGALGSADENNRGGAIAAWAWGASRVLDAVLQRGDIDAARVAVVGHSRGGKAALWAGANDERFSVVVSNCSGCGGAAIGRRKFGETVKQINTQFPFWFNDKFKTYNGAEEKMPVDQHQLLALIAPRGVYVASATQDLWADQRGEFLSLVESGPVFKLYGFNGFKSDEMPPADTPITRDRVAYHIRTGEHDLKTSDWKHFMDFAEKVWAATK